MKTLYIDVYFFINFTVDLLALYFSSALYKLPTSAPRLMLASFVGSLYAVFGVLFLENRLIMYPVSLVILAIMVLIVSAGSTVYRKIKYSILFFVFEILIGGLVYYGYNALDSLDLTDKLGEAKNENKKLLIFSLLVLLSIGVLKLLIRCFDTVRAEKSADLSVTYNGCETSFSAFVDSGNLASDPFDKTPVMLASGALAEKIFKHSFDDPEWQKKTELSLRKKIRIIPVKFGSEKKILYGIRPDSVYAVKDGKKEKISLIIAIDKEGGNYGGYDALIPLSALADV